MKIPKAVTPYDQLLFDPQNFIDHVPGFDKSEASTGLCDLSSVLIRLTAWKATCPSVCPIYVLRRNDDPQLVKIASNYGCRFACSSRGEIEELSRTDVSADKIFWNCSTISLRDSKYARVAKINWIQVGRTSALHNIKQGHPEASIILNVSLPSPDILNGGAQLGFSHTEQEFAESLLTAKELNLNIRGIAMTKNDNWNNVTAEDVFYKANELVLMAESVGFLIESLTVPEIITDLSVESLITSLRGINGLADVFFAEKRPAMKIYCETNDSLTTASLSIFLTIQAVRRIKDVDCDAEKMQYFVDDGRHNSFRKVPRTVRYSEVRFIRRTQIDRDNSRLYNTEVYGPSCDGDDVVVANVLLPELSNGDLIYLTNVGSDTIATRTNFNGFLNCNSQYFVQRNDLIVTDHGLQLEKF